MSKTLIRQTVLPDGTIVERKTRSPYKYIVAILEDYKLKAQHSQELYDLLATKYNQGSDLVRQAMASHLQDAARYAQLAEDPSNKSWRVHIWVETEISAVNNRAAILGRKEAFLARDAIVIPVL